MQPITLLILPNSSHPHLKALDRLPPSVRRLESDDAEEAAKFAPEADVILNAGFKGEPFRTIFPLAKKVRWVHSLSTGVEGILSPELIASPVSLTNGRGAFRNVLAEWALGAVLYFAKDFRRLIHNQERGVWEQFDVDEVRVQTLGIIGYGEIGRTSGQLARAFGMKVLAVRRNPAASEGDTVAKRVYGPDQILDMLPQCDYVLLATPNAPSARGLIGERELAAMKRSAVVINVGRGPVIVEAALIHALENGVIRGAALDVFEHEPLPEEHPFYRMPNVLFSPHSADHTHGWIELAAEVFMENFDRFAAGQPLKNIVDKEAGY